MSSLMQNLLCASNERRSCTLLIEEYLSQVSWYHLHYNVSHTGICRRLWKFSSASTEKKTFRKQFQSTDIRSANEWDTPTHGSWICQSTIHHISLSAEGPKWHSWFRTLYPFWWFPIRQRSCCSSVLVHSNLALPTKNFHLFWWLRWHRSAARARETGITVMRFMHQVLFLITLST